MRSQNAQLHSQDTHLRRHFQLVDALLARLRHELDGHEARLICQPRGPVRLGPVRHCARQLPAQSRQLRFLGPCRVLQICGTRARLRPDLRSQQSADDANCECREREGMKSEKIEKISCKWQWRSLPSSVTRRQWGPSDFSVGFRVFAARLYGNATQSRDVRFFFSLSSCDGRSEAPARRRLFGGGGVACARARG